jgi:GTP-binding protein Era
VILLINKIDRFPKPRLLPIMDRYSKEYPFLEIIPISALTGENLDALLNAAFNHLHEGEPHFAAGYLTDKSERFLTAELIREKVVQHTREELPYSTAVLVRKFDEEARPARKLVRIEADILVEKKSQQGIILGKGGATLRDLGTAARKDIEELLGCRVYLGLRVRTVQKWRDNESVLDELEVGR